MSVLDAFFGRGGAFRAARCKTLLKLTIPRIKLLRNRREMQLKQMRRDIANLLGSGQEATARIRVEHIIREENMIAAQEILELFCELVVVRLPIIEIQRECPLDLKEAISSICFAAPRCADLPELQQAQMMFASKYGRDFANAAAELLPESGVNRQIIEMLSVRAPAIEAKLKLLKEIAEEHCVDWDPLESETEYEDLLNGPSQLVNPPARFKKTATPQERAKSDSDSECDLDLPDVPRAAVPPPPSTDPDHEHGDVPPPKSSNQFLPFAAPPLNPAGPLPLPPAADEAEKHSAATSSKRSELDKDLQDAVVAANAAAETAERAAAAARLAASLAQVKMNELVERTDRVSEERAIDGDDDKGEEPVESLQTVEEDLLPASPAPDGRQILHMSSMEYDPYFSYPNLFSRQNSSATEPATGVHPPGTDSSIHKFS